MRYIIAIAGGFLAGFLTSVFAAGEMSLLRAIIGVGLVVVGFTLAAALAAE